MGADLIQIGVLLSKYIIGFSRQGEPNGAQRSQLNPRPRLAVHLLDRLYINGYVATLQTSGHLCYFLKQHLGNLVPSPALLGPMHDRFVREVKRFSQRHQVPLIQFERRQRKDDVAAKYREKFKPSEGVVFIGVAQERASSFKAHKTFGPRGGVHFQFSRQPVAVNHYYFYLQDKQWGPAFVKVGTYLPYPVTSENSCLCSAPRLFPLRFLRVLKAERVPVPRSTSRPPAAPCRTS